MASVELGRSNKPQKQNTEKAARAKSAPLPAVAASSAGSAPAASAAVEARLAAFGEAFLSSIDRQKAPRDVKRAPKANGGASPLLSPAGSPAFGPKQPQPPGSIGGSGGARRRRQKRRERAASEHCVLALPGDASSSRASSSSVRPLAAAAAPTGVAASSSSAGHSLPAPRISAAEKRRFMSGKVADIRSKGTLPPTGRRRKAGEDPEEDAEFKKTLREVLDFVTPQLGKQERRQYEEARIRALGGTLEKRAKMPYKMLQDHHKRGEANRLRTLEEEKTLGVSMSVSKHRKAWGIDQQLKRKKEELKEKKRKREDGLLRLGMGAKEKRGMAVISKGALKRFRDSN